MNGNYNDIIDVILTFNKDEEISKSIVVSGSIVPYLVLNKESLEQHTDFYFLVKSKNIDSIRKKVKKLSKVYQFDVIIDSKNYSSFDCGFKIKYNDTVIGFFPYSIIDNSFTIKTFSISNDRKEIKLKTKTIPNVSKNSIIRLINFGGNTIRIMSPEFVLADKESRENQPGNPTVETMKLLNKLSDETVLEVLRKSVGEIVVKIDSKPLRRKNYILNILIFILLLLFILIAYICFKK